MNGPEDAPAEIARASQSPLGRGGTVVPALFVLMWSSAFIAGVFGVSAAPPLLLVFARFAIAGVLLTLLALVVGAPWPRGRELGHVMVCGVLMQALQFGAFYTALDKGLPAAMVAMLQGLNPIAVALLSGSMLGERLDGRHWLGFGLGAAGVLLAVFERIGFAPSGVILCLLGLAGLSLGTVYQKRFAPHMNVMSGTAVHFLISAPVVAAAMLLLETPRVTAWGPFATSLAWMVLVNSVGAFLLLNTMLRRSAASRVSTLFFLTPSVTAVLAWLLVGQALQPAAVFGLALSGVGVHLATRR
ncbi:DMT family transporter [Aquisalimonas lutea]|uniref:DMT family transporter n=1 Tax=Aquisalimonas lutea TaxID=1327750 RepID=UPI0025B50403|nr:DMT family transporter [Aquisalimonas lutea]MDN3516583.1 DMT family transporter [Aquisalimonas lutea]